MALPRDLVRAIRRLDEAELRQLLILGRGLLIDSEAPVVEVDDVPGMPAVRYTQKHVSCNKAGCSKCPHGPYWYAHWHEGGRKRSQYVGSELPAQVRRRLEAMDAEEEGRRRAVGGQAGRHDEGSGPRRPPLRIV